MTLAFLQDDPKLVGRPVKPGSISEGIVVMNKFNLKFRKGERIMRSILLFCAIGWCSATAFSDVNDTAASSHTSGELEKRLDSLEVQVAKLKMGNEEPAPLKWGTGVFQQISVGTAGPLYKLGYLFEHKKENGTFSSIGPVIGLGIAPNGDTSSIPLDVSLGFKRGSPILANIVNYSFGVDLVGRFDSRHTQERDSTGLGLRSDINLNLWISGKNCISVGQQIGFLVTMDGDAHDLGSSETTCSWTHYFGSKPKRIRK
jgi:hypothetical protein